MALHTQTFVTDTSNVTYAILAAYVCYRQHVITTTCGRPGVGAISYIDLFVDGTLNNWHVSWVSIDNGLEFVLIQCNAYELNGLTIERFYV